MSEIHYTKIKPSDWKWKNFTPKELACKGDGLIIINEDTFNRLQMFREKIGVPFTPNSVYRSKEYNKKVGGEPNSYHMKSMAIDVPITDRMPRALIHKIAKECGFKGFGDYNTFVHIDTGPARYWDRRK